MINSIESLLLNNKFRHKAMYNKINKKPFLFSLSSNNFKNKLLNSKISNKYNLCLIRTGRRKNPLFKVVVTNYNRRKIDIIGVFLPNANLYKKTGVFYQNSNLIGRKQLNIDFEKLFFWLRKRIVPSVFVYHLIKSIEQNFFFLTSQYMSINRHNIANSVFKNSFIQEYVNE